MTDSLSVADVMALQNRDNCCYNNGNGGFGNWGDGGWIFLLFILLTAGRGWGGFGGYGGFGGFGGYGVNGADFQGVATRADINGGFAFNNLQRGVQGIQQGICDSTYALNNAITSGFHGVDSALCNGFNGVNNNISNLGYNLQNCCCQTQRAIDGVRYDMAAQASGIQNSIQNVRYDMATQDCATRNLIQSSTRDITDNANANTRAILDFLTQDKISSLQAENQALKFQASQSAQNAFITANQEAQTAELIRRLGADCPVNAYVVQPPTPVTFPTNYFGGTNFSNGNCGCGCGCNSCC